ncbi:MAG TPA: hypothetical protein VGP72_00605 [Planctomycetota bacterium]|jgi:hypothetical protein
MPVRSLNYTNRKRIERSSVSIRLVRSQDQSLSFEGKLRLVDYGLPPEASVFVEAYRSAPAVYMRFPFGTVAAPVAPPDCALTEFEGSEAVLFRVKVVDGKDARGKLLAEADRISPISPEEEDASRIGLLPIKSENLGEQIWRVDFNEKMPILLINNTLDKLATARSDAFIALAYPSILRQILTQILVVEKHTDLDDDDDWKTLWLRFISVLPGLGEPPVEDIADVTKQQDWIEDAVSAFCSWQKTLTHRFQAAFRQGDEKS